MCVCILGVWQCVVENWSKGFGNEDNSKHGLGMYGYVQ